MPSFFKLFGRIRRNQHVILYILALLIGIISAYGAIAFRLLIDGVQILSMGFGGEALSAQAQNVPWWRMALAPIGGGIVVALMLRFLIKNRTPKGIPDVMAANAISNARMPLREGLITAVISATSMGAGASTGREGPIVHLGATLASFTAERLHLNPALARTLLACGVASAVAASFNAPIAGVFFALEVILGHYAIHAFAPIVVASVVGTIVSRAHLGDYPAFIIPPFEIVSMWEFPAFALLGLVCAAVAIIFIWSAFFAEDVMKARLPMPRWTHPIAGGCVLAVAAVFFPHVLGVGYEATDGALQENFGLWMLFALLVFKVAATAISLGAGFGGGVFSPALFVGAMTGGAFGILAAMVFPDLAASQGLYAIVGMGAVAGAVLGAPISTFLIVFELVGDYELSIAIMMATATASIVTQQAYTKSYFRKTLERRGLDLKAGRAGHILQTLKVGEVMDSDYRTVREGETLPNIQLRLAISPHGTLFVIDAEKRFLGHIGPQDISGIEAEDNLGGLARAADIMRELPNVLFEDDTLQQALAQMDVTDDDHIAVLDSEESRQVVGVLHHRDALRAYNRALEEERREEHGES